MYNIKDSSNILAGKKMTYSTIKQELNSKLIEKLKNINTFLFDMDGTLVNTEILHAKAANKVLLETGIQVDLEANLSKFYGMADTEVLKALIPNLKDSEIHQLIERKNFYLIKYLKDLKESEKEVFITPGFFNFLDSLIQNNKISAVVSASEDVIVAETLACFGIDKKIKLQMGRNQTQKTKPHPDPYIEAMKRLSSTIGETVIFEDSPTGIQSAIATGCSVFRITHFAHCSFSFNQDENKFIKIQNFNNLLA